MRHAFAALIHYGAVVAAWLFVTAGVMLTYEVVARYFFTKPTIWAAELSQLCLIWGSMLALAYLLKSRRHIQVDALIQLCSPAVQAKFNLLAMLIITVFSLIVMVYGVDIFLDSFGRGRTTGSMLDLPIWINELAIPVGFALLAIQSLLEL